MRIGVLGGTFDPIHRGHTALAEAARHCAKLDRVVLVPSRLPPHRPPPVAPANDRLAMCRLAAASRADLDVSDVELRRSGPSYTIDTLHQLRRANPDADLFLVLGWDAARDIREWQRPDEVLGLAGLVIVARPGLASPTAADIELAGIPPKTAQLCQVATPAVNATEIRRMAAQGQPLDGLVEPAVAAYIREHGLYA